MKKCPFFIIIIFSVLAVSVYGLLLKYNVVQGGESLDEEDSTMVEAAAAVHVIKSEVSTALGIADDEDFPDDDDIPVWTPPTTSENKTEDDDDIVEVTEASLEEPQVVAKDIATDEEYKNNPEGFVNSETDNASAIDYGTFTTVGNEYFEGGDTCFIGDSRMQGFGMYSGIKNADLFAVKAYAIYTVFTKPVFDSPTGKLTLLQEMEQNAGKYKKVYIMFGINEMGWANEEKFQQCYYQLIDMVKYYQPEAVIYVESVLHVTKEKAQEAPKFSNENIDKRNAGIKQVAEDEHVVYLDLNSVYNDEEGYLPAECTSDGVHIKADYMKPWVDYLKTHAIAVK
ncbi:MAG: hypothetical protein K6F39_09245 [Lachnospiraceae bacterium]|nr:hypothetical protein [Lachnospiraceae bacterium]